MTKNNSLKHKLILSLTNKKILKRIFFYFLILFFLLILSRLFFIYLDTKNEKSKTQAHKNIETPLKKLDTIRQNCIKNPLTNLDIKQKNTPFTIIAVVIDNHELARPQYGLAQAGLVYETEVEGGITRYLAFFTSYDDVEKIGPIRSARHYFLDWSQGFSSLFVHCGGSPQALAELAGSPINNLNEFYKNEYFQREQELPQPHNIFTSISKINKYLEENDFLSSNIKTYRQRFYNKNTPEKKNKQSQIVNIMYKSGYKVRWEYNKQKNLYIRYLDGEKHITGKENTVTSKNLIIQYIPATIKDEQLRLERQTLGEGKAIVCQNGYCQNGYWKKRSKNQATQYFSKTATGEYTDIKLIPGTTWIEIVKPKSKIIY